MNKKMIYATFFMCSSCMSLCLAGNVVVTPETTPLTIQTTTIDNTQQQIATAWGLSFAQYQQYLWVMQHTPSGHWYKQLDPAEVLALNSNNPNEMMQYAKIEAQLTHEKVTRELAFNWLYQTAYQQLYPNEKPIMPNTSKHNLASLAAGDRVWLFVDGTSPFETEIYQHLLAAVRKTPNTQLDIYFVGKNTSRQSIEAWALKNQVPRAWVNQTITLNFDDGRFMQIEQGKLLTLPYVGIVHNNHFQPISLSSVL